jgi:hypothetical protein
MKSFFFIILSGGFLFINQLAAEEPQRGTRIVISASGEAKFISYLSDEPAGLTIEFRSRNILSRIDEEMIVNQGGIKKITSSYYEEGENSSLKSLTFELTQKVEYEIRQEHNTIILDIQTPFPFDGKEVFVSGEHPGAIIKRLEVMDDALAPLSEGRVSIDVPAADTEISAEEDINEDLSAGIPAKSEPIKERSSKMSEVFWFAGLTMISGLGVLTWYRRGSDMDEKLKQLESELKEKDNRMEQEEIIGKAMEKAASRKEKPLISSEKSQERRNSLRLPLTKDFNRTIILRIGLGDKSPLNIKSFAGDISADGLNFETKTEFKEKEPINLRLFFYGDRGRMIKARARIVWKKTKGQINCYGVLFNFLEEEDRLKLNRYIESNLGKVEADET